MVITGVQKLTLLDYPGRCAATLFSPGCNFRCPFCHNATLATSDHNGQLEEDEVLAFLKKRQGILEGVCFTGGEPLLQEDIGAFMEKVKALGYLIKLDTNGYRPARLRELLASGLLDYVAMDIKNSPARYAVTAGRKAMDFDRILESIALLESGPVAHEFRTTVVRELHDAESLRGAAHLVAGTQHYYLQGFVDSGDLIMPGLTGYAPDEMRALLQAVREEVPLAELRGV